MSLRRRIEGGFEQWAELVLRWRIGVATASVLLVAGLSVGLQWLTIETSFESYLPQGNPAQAVYEHFREQFGSGERVVVLLRPAALYDPDFLAELRALHRALEDELPYVDEITSLANARHLVGTADTLLSEELLDELPRSPAELDRLRARVADSPWYRNIVVAGDESSTAIVIELDGALEPASGGEAQEAARLDAILGGFEDGPGAAPEPGGELLSTAQSNRLAAALDEVLARHAPASAELFVAGTPLLARRLGRMLNRDIVVFVSLSVVLTAAILLLLFRSFWATFHPLLVVALSVVGVLGWMGWVGVPITAVTEILPSLLVALGVADSVHIQAMFFKQREEGQEVPAAIRWAMGHSGLAVLLTSLTTAASMAAFRSAELQPVIDLGRVAPVGVALALFFSTTLLPVLLASTPMESHGSRGRRRAVASRIDTVLLALGRFGTRRPRSVLAASAALAAVAAAGTLSLRFSQDDLRWLPQDDPIRIATEQLNASMEGAEPFELLIELDAGLDLREPDVLAAIAEIERRLGELRVGEVAVAQSLSLVDVVQETHRALADDPGSGLRLPDSREAVSQELLLFESAAPDDLERLVDAGFSTTRVAITVPFVDALHYPRFADAARDVVRQVLEERGLVDDVRVRPTGLLMLAGETFDLLFVSMARSYAIAFGVIAVMMLLLIGELRLGLLSVIPNGLPILLVLGLMGWLDTPLDVSSMLVGGILIGVVVDDTIHFAHNYARYRSEHPCSLAAIRDTLATTGRAMLVTSLVLSIGFFSFTAAYLSNIQDFGLLCGLGVVLAFLADVVLLPALVALANPCDPDCPAHGHCADRDAPAAA